MCEVAESRTWNWQRTMKWRIKSVVRKKIFAHVRADCAALSLVMGIISVSEYCIAVLIYSGECCLEVETLYYDINRETSWRIYSICVKFYVLLTWMSILTEKKDNYCFLLVHEVVVICGKSNCKTLRTHFSWFQGTSLTIWFFIKHQYIELPVLPS